MGIEPRHDSRYVAEVIGYSRQPPSKTVHNRVTDAKKPRQIRSNSCQCDERRNATGRPRPKVGKRLFDSRSQAQYYPYTRLQILDKCSTSPWAERGSVGWTDRYRTTV